MEKDIKINMTADEKYRFAEELNKGKSNVIKFYEKTIKEQLLTFVILDPIICLIVWWIGVALNIFLPIFLIISILLIASIVIMCLVQLNKVVLGISNNKLNYKQYRFLKKLGLIDKWITGDIEADNTESVANETQDSVTLTEEEYAVFKKIMGKGDLDSEFSKTAIKGDDKTE